MEPPTARRGALLCLICFSFLAVLLPQATAEGFLAEEIPLEIVTVTPSALLDGGRVSVEEKQTITVPKRTSLGKQLTFGYNGCLGCLQPSRHCAWGRFRRRRIASQSGSFHAVARSSRTTSLGNDLYRSIRYGRKLATRSSCDAKVECRSHDI